MLIASFRPLFVNENAGPECSAALLRKETSRKELARKISRKSTLLIESLLLELDSMNDESGNFAKAGFSFVFDYAWRAFCASAEESARKETHPAVEKALGLLMRGNTEKLTALARASGLSPSALCRLFKAQTGLSIVDYKNKLKVARFIELYGDGRKNNMTAAAYEAGFGSYAQFYRIFAQITGTSPRQYQKQRPG